MLSPIEPRPCSSSMIDLEYNVVISHQCQWMVCNPCKQEQSIEEDIQKVQNERQSKWITWLSCYWNTCLQGLVPQKSARLVEAAADKSSFIVSDCITMGVPIVWCNHTFPSISMGFVEYQCCYVQHHKPKKLSSDAVCCRGTAACRYCDRWQ